MRYSLLFIFSPAFVAVNAFAKCLLLPTTNGDSIHSAFRGFNVSDASGLGSFRRLATSMPPGSHLSVGFTAFGVDGVTAFALTLDGAPARVIAMEEEG